MNNEINKPHPIFGEVIACYTRAEAIADGVLIDVSETAREAGITFPVAVTDNVWRQCVEWTGGGCQDERGRLWDVVWMLRHAIKCAKGQTRRLEYQVRVIHRANNRPKIHRLICTCGPGDNGEPVITIMFPEDD